MCNYLKQWYKTYGELVKPLTTLLKKGMSVVTDWGPEQQTSFERLKSGFMQYPILRLPDFDKPFVLVTDRCKHVVGGAIM